MTSPIRLPENARFTCQSCGSCCQGWAVPVDQATVDRLRAHGWGADPFVPTPTAGEPFRIKLVEGRCFFLDPQNRCRIHTELSYDEKPAVCKSFPLSVLEVAGTRYARLSFWCPTVAANTGKPLEHQARWLKETSKHIDHRESPLTINDKAEVSPRDFEKVHQALRRLLAGKGWPLADRLAAASTLVRRLDAAALGGPVLVDSLVSKTEAEGVSALAAEGRKGGHPAAGRRMLALYLMQDRAVGRWANIARFASVVSFSAGLAPLGSRAMSAKASWRQVRRVAFDLAEGDELLTRYLCSKIDSRRYVAGRATLVTGFNLIVAAYGMINVLARMKAASHGEKTCRREDVELAVRVADLLVVEHPSLYHGAPQERVLVQTALGGSSLCADVLARLEQ